MSDYFIFLIPALPLFGAIINLIFGMNMPRRAVESIAIGAVLLATIATITAWPLSSAGVQKSLFVWLSSGMVQVDMSLLFDRLSAPMCLMVTAVSTLIHCYGAAYMQHDHAHVRFFVLLNLFVFSMLMIVLSDNLLLLFLGWEGVGFCSYALIGFWYQKKENADAGRKAFIVTKIGDIFLLVGILIIILMAGTLSISSINQQAELFSPELITLVTLLLLAGACGKSAQLPLMSWLPDAMAGPTPVSALIHAATMVTAGVYLLCRLFPMISLSPLAMAIVATVGALTALYAATCALAQREIKRILAYSTMSQVGYMIMAVGAGSVTGAMFHLFTHAFFKAVLFMGAGALIHLAAQENDVFKMGGMKKRNPLLFWLFIAGGVCLAGVPFTGGFFSKDLILLSLYDQSGYYTILFAIGLFTAFLTSLYTFRMLYLVFAGSYRGEKGERGIDNHDVSTSMLWPLIPLAILGLGGGLLNLPELFPGGEMLRRFFALSVEMTIPVNHSLEFILAAVSSLAVAAGWLLARKRYGAGDGKVQSASDSKIVRFFLHGWYVDRLFDLLLVRPFNALGRFWSQGVDQSIVGGIVSAVVGAVYRSGERLRYFTTGRVSTYVAGMVWGFLLIMCGLTVRFLVAG